MSDLHAPLTTHPSNSQSSPPLTVSSRYPWLVVGMLWFICFFNYADRQAIFSVFPLLESKFGFNKTQLGWIGLAFTWVYALTAPLAGQVGDRCARKTIIISGLYIWSAITGFTSVCSKLWHFVLVRGAEGLGETFYFPASMSLISDYHAPATRSRAMSLHQTSVYAGTIGGGAFAGWMGQHYGWRSPFVVLAIAGVILGVVLATFIREPLRNEAEQSERGVRVEDEPGQQRPTTEQLPMSLFLRELLRTPTALLLVMAFFGANFVALVFLVWMPTFLTEKFSLQLAVAGVGATVFIQTASMIGSVCGGVLADRWRLKHAGGRIGVQALGMACGAPFVFLCGYLRDVHWLLVAMTLFGFCKGIYDSNIWASMYDVIPSARRSTMVGLANMVGWFGGGLGSLAIGVAVNNGMTMSAAISATAVIYLTVAMILLVGALVFAPRDAKRLEV